MKSEGFVVWRTVDCKIIGTLYNEDYFKYITMVRVLGLNTKGLALGNKIGPRLTDGDVILLV